MKKMATRGFGDKPPGLRKNSTVLGSFARKASVFARPGARPPIGGPGGPDRPKRSASVLAFTAQVFDFVEAAVASGGAVLIHCLAGAHRAGTTGVLCLMRKTGLDRKAAVAAAKKLRPAIDPIGSFPELLKRYEEAKDPKACKYTEEGTMVHEMMQRVALSDRRMAEIVQLEVTLSPADKEAIKQAELAKAKEMGYDASLLSGETPSKMKLGF